MKQKILVVPRIQNDQPIELFWREIKIILMIVLSTRTAHQFGRWSRFICGAKTTGSVFTPGALPLAIDDALSGL
jgi:hypothetical protein